MSPPTRQSNHLSIYAKWFKRPLDFTFALFLLVLLFPVLLILYVWCRLAFGSPVFFKQMRPGLNGKTFQLIKFRTMTNERDAEGKLLSDDKRLTSFGKFLRSSSLDELPELLNIIKGEMSFVGPRPLLVEYLPLYSSQQARRHEVRPGLTGWAQVNGRNALSWREKFEMDVWYVDRVSFFLDVRIAFHTIAKIITRDGITATNSATMPVFKGQEESTDGQNET